MIKNSIKKLRSLVIINIIIRIIIKGVLKLKLTIPDNVLQHFSVSGIVKINLPNNKKLKLFSKGDDYIPSRVFWYGYDGYEYSIIPFYYLSKKAKVIVDIGANIGYYSLVGAAANKQAKVYAFEPVPRIANRFRKQIAINEFFNIAIEEKVVGDVNTEVSFYIPVGNTMALAASTKKGWVSETEEVKVKSVTLDSFKKEKKIGNIDLIKMDCEFHELEVLKGMDNILKTDKPDILMEVLFPEAEGVKGHFENKQYLAIEKIMKENGYLFYIITKEKLIKVDTLVYNRIDRNYLFSVKDTHSDEIFYQNLNTQFV